ncbi:MAG: alpha/beta hydrolase [Acholeplasmatales bacterium]|jgi:pimeloyl-ACP methyl ester carboxylesterase|nr:alpha/beta hydrolase [Acholeplasmatales bacterium]
MISTYIKSIDTKIYTQIFNENKEQVLCFLHGNGESGEYFYNLLPYFSEYKIILIDTRNHNKSDKVDGYLDFKTIAADFINVINYLNIKKCDIIGYSDGGNTILELLKNRCDIINKAVLISPNLSPKYLHAFLRIKLYLYEAGLLLKKKDDLIKNKIILANLMLKEPNFKYSDFENINTNSIILSAQKDVVSIKHLDILANILNIKHINIKKSTHANICYNSEAIDIITNFLNN